MRRLKPALKPRYRAPTFCKCRNTRTRTSTKHWHWHRRQRTAGSTLVVQALGGTAPNAETLGCFRCDVRGEIILARAIAQLREQLAREHAAFRQCLNRGGNQV